MQTEGLDRPHHRPRKFRYFQYIEFTEADKKRSSCYVISACIVRNLWHKRGELFEDVQEELKILVAEDGCEKKIYSSEFR